MSSSSPNDLRVVVLDHVARVSGGEIALLRVLPKLAKHVEVHVLFGEDGPMVEQVASVGLKVEVLPLAPRLRDLRKDTVQLGSLNPLAVGSLPGYVLRLARRLRELEPDIVHTNSLKAALYGGLAGRLSGSPVVWHIRDRISDDYLPAGAVRMIHLAGRLLPTAVIANSHTTLGTLSPTRRTDVVPNPVVPDVVDRWPPCERLTRPTVTFGIAGRLAPWKGQVLFLDAFAAAFRGTEVRAHIIGAALFDEDDYAASLRSQVERLGIASQVDFRGFRADMWEEFGRLDVLVHSSVVPEPFGQVVLEGMAAGLPVVAPNAGGPAELITDGVDGMLVAPNDVHALASALVGLRHDAALRARLGEAAAARARAFTPERAAIQLGENYRWIVANGRR